MPSPRPLCCAMFHGAARRQSAAELFASLVDDRAHFGKGVYAAQHEPAVWRERIRMLLNNYSNGDPLRANTGDEESNKRNEEWGDKNPQGHRAAFCVPLIVPKDMAYNIFERQTPDISGRLVDGKRRIALGEDYKGRKVHSNRDVWVIRIEGGGEVQHAKMKADALANVLEKRLQKLWSAGLMTEVFKQWLNMIVYHLNHPNGDMFEQPDCRTLSGIAGRLDCMAELAERYQGRARFGDAEPLLTQIYAECQGKEPEASKSLASLAVLMHEQGKLYDAEPLLRKALTGLQRSVGDDHPDTVRCKKQFTGLLQDIGSEGKIAALERTGRTKPSHSEEDAAKEKLKAAIGRHGPGHPATYQAMQELAMVLEARGSFDEAEQLFHMSGGRPKAASQAAVSASAARKAEFQEKLRALGNMHPETLKAMHLLTASLHQEGQLKEAEQMGRQALKSRREKLGDTHPDTLESMHELGVIFKAMGNMKLSNSSEKDWTAAGKCWEALITTQCSSTTLWQPC